MPSVSYTCPFEVRSGVETPLLLGAFKGPGLRPPGGAGIGAGRSARRLELHQRSKCIGKCQEACDQSIHFSGHRQDGRAERASSVFSDSWLPLLPRGVCGACGVRHTGRPAGACRPPARRHRCHRCHRCRRRVKVPTTCVVPGFRTSRRPRRDFEQVGRSVCTIKQGAQYET
jgi:hypothetical protein